MTDPLNGGPASPYKGLAAFEDSHLDALCFFGRTRDTEVIAANLIASRLTVLYGPPGVGKSSVLRAGVVRRLRSLAPEARVHVHDSWAGDAGGDLLRAVAGEGDAYVLLDQFEEVFAYSGAAALAGQVAEIVTRPDLRVNVLLSLRDDALSELDVFTGQIPNVFGNYLALERLDRAAAREAVTGPLDRYNELSNGHDVSIEDHLVEAVLDQVQVGRVVLSGPARIPVDMGAEGEIEAPYLQLVMERLWGAESERGSPVLRRATLDELGGAQSIVRAHLDEAVESLGREERDVAARIFNHLVTPSGTKIAHDVGDLAEYAGVREEELEPTLESLVRNRILRPVDGRFEIFHDVLAEAVLAWRARHEGERALELQRAEAERSHRRLLVLLASALVVLGVMSAVAIYALTQRAEAREQAEAARAEAQRAEASRLAAEAGVLIPATQAELDPELSLALAAEAARLAATPRAVNTLRRALLVSHLRAVLPERRVTSAAFSPDGARIVVATEDGTAVVRDADTGRELTSIEVGNPVTTAAFSPDGESVLTTERDGPAKIWDAATGTELRSVGREPVAASFSPDSSLVLTVEPSGAQVWLAADGSEVAMLRQRDPVRAASFGPDGDLVATVGSDSTARVFDALTGDLVAAVDHGGSLTGATIVPGGRELVTTGRDRVARVWTLPEGGFVRELKGHSGQITAGVVSGDGTLLVTTSADQTARVWELATGRLVAVLLGHGGRVDGAAFSTDSSAVVTWGAGGTARVGEARSAVARALLAGHGDVVTGASFDTSGEFVVTTSADGRTRLWRSRVESEPRALASVAAPVTGASFSEDGGVAAFAGRSGIEILSTADGSRDAFLPAVPAEIVAPSPDGSLVAAARGSAIPVWRVETADPVGGVMEDETATAVALSPDGDRLAIGTTSGDVGLWTLAGRRISMLAGPGRAVSSVAFGPSGDSLAAGFEDGTLVAWSVPEGRSLYQRREHREGTPILSVAFSPRGDRLVTSGADSTVRVWNAATGRALYELRGHSGPVTDAAFSPDGDWIVTAGHGVAGLWDPSIRQRLFFLQGDIGRLLAAAFDPTSRAVVTMGADGVLRRYACEVCGGVADLLALAERRLEATGRDLTPAERRHYFEGG